MKTDCYVLYNVTYPMLTDVRTGSCLDCFLKPFYIFTFYRIRQQQLVGTDFSIHVNFLLTLDNAHFHWLQNAIRLARKYRTLKLI